MPERGFKVAHLQAGSAARCVLIALLLTLVVCGGGPASAQSRRPSATTLVDRPEMPRKIGLTESAGVTLTLIDIEVRDENGRPTRGLTKKDFTVFLGVSEWPIYSVDESCGCEEPAAVGAGPLVVSAGGPAAVAPLGSAGKQPGASSASTRERSVAPPGQEVGAAVAATGTSGAGAGSSSSAPGGSGAVSGSQGAGSSLQPAGSGDTMPAPAKETVTPIGPEAGAAAVAQGTPKGNDSKNGSRLEPPARYVLYFDFSQLQITGRSRALEEARRWIRETRKPGDKVMVEAFATFTGLRELCPFTVDEATLLAAVDRAARDPELMDSFPSAVDRRQEECVDSTKACLEEKYGICELPTLNCVQLARDEAAQGRRSLRALRIFLGGLQMVEGRKALILFQENGTIFPSRLYENVTDFDSGSHEALLEQVGAEAVSGRTAIYAAYTGDSLIGNEIASQAVYLGSNLADFTGGRYNRDLGDLSQLTSSARETCPCYYRIALLPEKNRTSRIYQASVQVRGKDVPWRWRVQFLDDIDRWMRQAAAVLESPETAKDIEIAAAIVPVKSAGGAWDLTVQVAFDVASLLSIPSGEGRQSSWEVGAVLAREDGTGKKEMLALSSSRRKQGGSSEGLILHESEFHGLEPGTWRLAAFVRDRTAGLFGGSEVSLEVPRPGGGAAVGPLLLLSKRHIAAPLPILEKSPNRSPEVAEARDGPVPGNPREAVRGEVLSAMTWFCPAKVRTAPRGSSGAGDATETGSAARGYIARDGKPMFRLEDAVIEPAGECFRVVDTIKTAFLEPGRYEYHVRWPGTDARKQGGSNKVRPIEAGTSFEVVPPRAIVIPPAATPASLPGAPAGGDPPDIPPQVPTS